MEDKRIYYLTNRKTGYTYEIGNENDLINYLSCNWTGDRKYTDVDLTGNDKSWQPVEYWGWKRYFVPLHDNAYSSEYVMRYVKIHEEKLLPKPYMFIDDAGTVVNPHNFDKEVQKVKYDTTSFYDKKYNGNEYGVKLFGFSWRRKEKKTFRFRCDSVPYIHNYNSWHCSYRGHRAQLWKNKEDLRPKCRIEKWELWDPKERHVDRCWKSSCKKRHQWQKHQK